MAPPPLTGPAEAADLAKRDALRAAKASWHANERATLSAKHFVGDGDVGVRTTLRSSDLAPGAALAPASCVPRGRAR